MIDLFAIISGFGVLCFSTVVTYLVRRIVPTAVIVGLVALIACVAAVRLELFEDAVPLFVIYANGALMGALLGYVLIQRSRSDAES